MKRLIIFSAVVLLGLSSAKSWADGTGLTLVGTLNLPSNPGVNYFDSANGAVPAGYGNSNTNGTVVIGSEIEFAATNGSDLLTLDFTGTTLTVTDTCTSTGCGTTPFSFAIYSPYITGYSTTSFDFANASASFGYDSDFGGDAGMFVFTGDTGFTGGTATFDYTTDVPATVPEPGTLGLMVTGLVGAAGAVRRRFIA